MKPAGRDFIIGKAYAALYIFVYCIYRIYQIPQRKEKLPNDRQMKEKPNDRREFTDTLSNPPQKFPNYLPRFSLRTSYGCMSFRMTSETIFGHVWSFDLEATLDKRLWPLVKNTIYEMHYFC